MTAVRVVSLDGTKAEDNYEKAVPESNEVKAGEPLKVKSYDAVKKIEPTVDTSDIALYRKTLSFTYTNSRVSLIAAWQYFDDETGKWVCIEESDTNANADSGDARFVPDKDLAGKVIRYVLFDTRLDKAYCTNGLAVVNNPSSYTICAIGSPEEGGTISLLGGTYLNEHNVAVYLGDTVIVSAYPNTGYKFVKS